MTQYTKEELAEFDFITSAMSSHNQLARIEGRMRLRNFKAIHGKEKLGAMFEELQRRDARGRKRHE